MRKLYTILVLLSIGAVPVLLYLALTDGVSDGREVATLLESDDWYSSRSKKSATPLTKSALPNTVLNSDPENAVPMVGPLQPCASLTVAINSGVFRKVSCKALDGGLAIRLNDKLGIRWLMPGERTIWLAKRTPK